MPTTEIDPGTASAPHPAPPKAAPQRPGSRNGRPAASGRREADPRLHLAHVREHIDRIRQGYTSVREPENVYLGPEDGDFFWEIVGFRLSGHPFPVVGAARFRRHDYPGVGDARESLAAFLSSPPRPPRSDESASPPGTISLLLPRATETIPAFLRGLRAGRSVARVHLDPELIEVAFDFRMHNPSALDSLRAKAGPLCQHLFRSARGHVIAGRCHGVVHGTERDRRFIALTEVEQRTPRGRFRLPALVLNRSFVALSADVSEEEARFASANWVPFLSTSASAKHLLLG